MGRRVRSTEYTFHDYGKPVDKPVVKTPEVVVDDRDILLGDALTSDDLRRQRIDEVERLLDLEGLGKGERHFRKNFDNPSVHNERRYFERK